MPDFFLPTPSPCRCTEPSDPTRPARPHRRVERLAPCRTSPPCHLGSGGCAWRTRCGLALRLLGRVDRARAASGRGRNREKLAFSGTRCYTYSTTGAAACYCPLERRARLTSSLPASAYARRAHCHTPAGANVPIDTIRLVGRRRRDGQNEQIEALRVPRLDRHRTDGRGRTNLTRRESGASPAAAKGSV